ncbi:MAG: hypothetical protein JWO14_3034 [Solirubrobacterales bacterium]|nr:hypothetical protein [Solirubrobacterales bacterium]
MGAEASPQTDPDPEENGGDSGNGSLPTGPWGEGGYDARLALDALPNVRDFVRSKVPELSRRTCEEIAHYIVMGLSSTSPEGPGKLAEVNLGNEEEENGKRVYNLLSRSEWSWKVVREKAVRATVSHSNVALPEGIVISWTFTDYEDPGAVIVAAHAFNPKRRALVAVQRAVPTDEDVLGLPEAIQELVMEIAALQARLATPVPVLVEAPSIGSLALLELAESNLDYLVELRPGWSEGGIIPADTGDQRSFSNAGASVGALFPDGWQTGATQSVPVRLAAESVDIPALALMAGPPGARRTYLAGARDRLREGQHQARTRRMREDWATKWCQYQLAGATDHYGFGKFRNKNDDHFHKHFTLVAVRDAYLVSGGRS